MALMTRTRTFAVLISVAVIVAAVAVAAMTTALGGRDEPPPEMVRVFGLERFPSDDLSYWVTYPTQVSVVTVVSEAEIPPPDRVIERGEGYVGRSVGLRVDRTLWSAPKVEAQTGIIEFVAFGWLHKGDNQIPFGSADGPRLEVGGRYVIPLVPIEDGWGGLSSSAVLAVDDGHRIALDQGLIKNPASLAQRGATLEQFARTLNNATPDPAAAPFAHLPPKERVEAVFRAASDG